MSLVALTLFVHSVGSVGEAAKKFLQNFQSFRGELSGSNNSRGNQVRCSKWSPPEQGNYKANFDGAMFGESDEAGIGIMVMDYMGQVVSAMAEKILKPHSVDSLEMLAARRAVIFASEIGLQQCQFEGDSETVIKAIKGCDLLHSSIGHKVKDTLIFVNPFRSSSFSHLVRQGNTVTHALSQRARISFPLLIWMKSIPLDVDAYVCADLSVF